MAKILVVGTAFGVPIFHEIAEEMCRSIQRSGSKADVAIMSDRPYEFTGARTHVVSPEYKAPPAACFYQSAVQYHEDLAAYDMVVRCDTDVVWVKPPEHLFEALSLRGGRDRLHGFSKILVTGTGHAGGTPYPDLLSAHQTYYFTPEERHAAVEKKWRGVNVGTTCVPGHLAVDFYRRFEDKWLELSQDRWENRDESVFNIMAYRGEIDIDFIPRSHLPFPRLIGNDHPEFCRELTGDVMAVHLLKPGSTPGSQKRVLLELMRDFNAARSFEEDAEWFARLMPMSVRDWEAHRGGSQLNLQSGWINHNRRNP
jgi:hypothetical protein